MTHKQYKNLVSKELDKLLDLMDRSWGFRPNLTLESSARVRIRIWAHGQHPWRADRDKWCIDSFYIDGETGKSCSKKFAKIAPVLYKQLGKKKATDYTVESYDLSANGVEYTPRLMKRFPDMKVDRLSYTAEPFIRVGVSFNLDGFAHEGQGFQISAKNMHRHRKPSRIARLIAQEISGHRNTCQRCGVGVAPISQRARGRAYMGDVNIPPDGVEEVINPRLSKKLRQRLEACNGPA